MACVHGAPCNTVENVEVEGPKTSKRAVEVQLVGKIPVMKRKEATMSLSRGRIHGSAI